MNKSPMKASTSSKVKPAYSKLNNGLPHSAKPFSVSGYKGSNYYYAAEQTINASILDTDVATLSAGWTPSTSVGGYAGTNYLYAPAGDGSLTATWPIPGDASQEVFVRYSSHANRATNATYTVSHADGETSIVLNQTVMGGTWVSLGVFNLNAQSEITLTNAADGYVIADAVKLGDEIPIFASAQYTLFAEIAGNYTVQVNYTSHDNRNTQAQYQLEWLDNLGELQTQIHEVNQTQQGGQWLELGQVSMPANGELTVTLSSNGEGYTITDAIQLVPITGNQIQTPASLSWPIQVNTTGEYLLDATWTSHANRATNATYRITDINGTTDIVVNQTTNGGEWHSLGKFFWSANEPYKVELLTEADGYVIADAVQITAVELQANQAGVFFIHNDHLGTPKLLTDTQGQIVWEMHTTPFGEVHEEIVSGITNLKAFPGQYRDSETRLSYNYYRDYDLSIGRYIQSDPIGLGGGLNTYGYVGGNPLIYSDPNGLVQWTGTTASVSVTGPIGAAVQAYTLYSECINGKVTKVEVIATGPAVGLGATIGSVGSNFTIEDGFATPYPGVFDVSFGNYVSYSYGVSVPGVGGYSASYVDFGGVSAASYTEETNPHSGEFSLSSMVRGSSTVTSVEKLPCMCE